MPMKNYVYTGPPSGVTLDTGEELTLFPNKTYPFDPEHAYTKTLLRMKYLQPVPAPAPSVKPKAKPKKTAAQPQGPQPEKE